MICASPCLPDVDPCCFSRRFKASILCVNDRAARGVSANAQFALERESLFQLHRHTYVITDAMTSAPCGFRLMFS